MVLSADDIAAISQIVGATMQGLLQHQQGAQSRHARLEDAWGSREVLDAKKMGMVDKFNGGETEYKDWARSFKGTIRMRCGRLVKLMERVEVDSNLSAEQAVEALEMEDEEN